MTPEVGQAFDRRIRFHRPNEFADREHILADDVQIIAKLNRGHRAGEIDFAIVEIAAE